MKINVEIIYENGTKQNLTFNSFAQVASYFSWMAIDWKEIDNKLNEIDWDSLKIKKTDWDNLLERDIYKDYLE